MSLPVVEEVILIEKKLLKKWPRRESACVEYATRVGGGARPRALGARSAEMV
jgi:hypothetical protein